MTTTTLGVTSSEVGPRLRRPRWASRSAWAVPAVLMLCLGLVGLDRHSVWRDEAATLVAVRRTLPELFSMLTQLETVHALYYTLLHGWFQLGSGETWARVPSVLAMAVAAGLVGVLGTRLVSAPVGLVAGLLFAVHPSVSYYAQEARSTAMVAACALLAAYLLLQALGHRRELAPDRRWWWAYAVAAAVLVGLNVLAVLVPVALGVTLLWWRTPRATLLRAAAASAPAVLVAGVLVLVSRQQPNQIGWIPRPGIGSVRDLVHLTLGPTLPLAAVMGLLVLAGAWPRGTASARRLRALAVPLLAVPSGLLLAASFVQPVFVPRYVLPSVAGVALLAGLGVVRLGEAAARRTGRPAALALVASALVLVVSAAGVGAQRLERTADSRPDDLAGAAELVGAQAQPGDAVLFLPDNRRLVALVYPDSFAQTRDASLSDSPEAAGNLTGRPLPLDATLHNLTESPRVWAIGRPGLSLLPTETDARAELALLERSFDAKERTGTHGVGVTLYVRRDATP
ncbi:glycosyltransferase family 39 protein [Microlunatus antarcticus]|uniref:Mannosyltransferase n=1 Tax=Microlunatus antarcticus TaxID=53388 RepID=A0A7W5JUX7_9ACTN|nr:mannosyltransferase [Microlunatus antarcticus]